MDRITKRIFSRKALFFVVPILVICVLMLSRRSELEASQILDYCKSHNEIRLSEITEFDWDIAYVDRMPYSNGDVLKEKYGIEGEFEAMESDALSRIAFCKDKTLVYDLQLLSDYIEIDPSVEVINYDSVFDCVWISIPEYKAGTLLLTLK